MIIEILLGILIVVLIVGLFLIHDKLWDINESISFGNEAIEEELHQIKNLIEDQDI